MTHGCLASPFWGATAPMSFDFSGLPAPVVLQVFCLAECARDAMAWKLSCKTYKAVCGDVDLLQLRVMGDKAAAVTALDSSSAQPATWFGLDLDFAPMQLVQQVGRGWAVGRWAVPPPPPRGALAGIGGCPPACPTWWLAAQPPQGRMTSPYVPRAEQAKLVESVMQVRTQHNTLCSIEPPAAGSWRCCLCYPAAAAGWRHQTNLPSTPMPPTAAPAFWHSLGAAG